MDKNSGMRETSQQPKSNAYYIVPLPFSLSEAHDGPTAENTEVGYGADYCAMMQPRLHGSHFIPKCVLGKME
jgi:hypothetical protein